MLLSHIVVNNDQIINITSDSNLQSLATDDNVKTNLQNAENFHVDIQQKQI